jgi:AcrR family transcriptional regulator
MTATSGPPQRKRDAVRTSEAILRAAQKLFAQKGYATTGVREIAAEAGVNSTLVRRYFGSKEGLLRKALEDVLTIEHFIRGSRAEFGVRAVANLLRGEAEPVPNPLAMIILATADPAARVLCRDLMHERIIRPLAEWLGGPGALDRAAQLNILWIGFMTARQIVPLQPLSDDILEPTRQWLEKLTQSIADN